MWSTVLHAGLIGSFMRLPYVPPQAEELRAAAAKAAIYEMPWDSTSISRTSANYRPKGIQEVSCQFTAHNATYGFDLIEALNPVDTGDCTLILANAEKTFANAQAEHRRDPRRRGAPSPVRGRPLGDDPGGPCRP